MSYYIYVTEQNKLSSSIDLGIEDNNYITFRAFEVSAGELLDTPPVFSFETSAVTAVGNIVLYKENYNNIDGTSDLVDLETTNDQFVYVKGIGSAPVEIFDFNYMWFDPADPYYLTLSNINLDVDQTYVMEFKGLGTTSGSASRIRFRTSNSQLNKNFQKIFNTEVNDIISKASILANLVDADKVFNQSDADFNFKTTIVNYNSDTQDYRPSEDTVNFDNSEVIEDLFLKQYLYDWQNYFKDLSDPDNNAIKSSDTGLQSREDLQQLKTIIAKNAYLFNQFKGNEIGMEYIADIFAAGLNYQFLGIDVNIYKTFNYTVTSNLPYQFWLSDIKPIIHPIPWNVYYDFIDEDTNKPYINFDDYYKIFVQKFTSLFDKCQSYIEFWDRPHNQYFKNTTFHNNMEVGDVDSHLEYRFRDNSYLVSYDVSAMLNAPEVSASLVQDLSDYRTDQPSGSNLRTDVYKFERDGIVDKYIWRLFKRPTPISDPLTTYVKIDEIESYDNSYSFTYDLGIITPSQYKVQCEILNNGFSRILEKQN